MQRRAFPTLPIVWWLTALSLVLLGTALAWHSTGDLDAPLHDRLGRDILSGAGIPTTNHFSFSAPDHPWANHEWGFQIALATAGKIAGGHDLGGRAAGWQWIRLLLTATLMALIARHLRRTSPALMGPAVLMALAMLWTRLTMRPELVSFLLLILVLERVEAALRQQGTSPWWRELVDPRHAAGQVLLLTLAWYQCHGFAALAPLIWLLAGLLGRTSRTRGARWRMVLGGAGLALVAGAMTPAGVAGLLLPIRALGQFGSGVDLQHTISELVPLLETRGSLALTLLVFQASLIWGLAWTVFNWGGVSRLRLVLWIVAAVAAWQGQRNLGFYAVTFILLHGDPVINVETPWQRLAGKLPRRLFAVGAGTARYSLPALTWILVVTWMFSLSSDVFYLREGVARRWGGGLTPAIYPAEQARLLADAGPLRVANTVDAASTLLAAGAGPVSIDGRTEAYPAAAWNAYADLKRGGPSSLQRLEQWRAEAVCLAHRNLASHPLLQTLLTDPQWALVDVDPAGALLRPRAPDDPADIEVLTRAGADLAREVAATPAGRDVRLADRLAAWASLLVLAGQEIAAEEVLLAAKERCPDHPTVLHNLGNLLLARGELRGSLSLFEQAARINRRAAPPLVNAGNCLFQLGRIEEAEAALKQAVRRDPDNFEGWANLAEVRRQRGDRDGAGRAYSRALELRPGDSRLRQRSRSLGSSTDQ